MFNLFVRGSSPLFSYEFNTFNNNIYYSFSTLLMIGGDSILFLNLFTQKHLFFILIGIILLFSMVGSIVLCVNQPEKK